MHFAETPVHIIKSSIDLFVFACFLQDAVNQELITPNSFRKSIRFDEGRGVDFKATYTQEQLRVYTSNLTLMALGNTAIATKKLWKSSMDPSTRWTPVPLARRV